MSGGSHVVGSGFGLALVVYNGPLTPFEPRAVEDADVNLPPALHKEQEAKLVRVISRSGLQSSKLA